MTISITNDKGKVLKITVHNELIIDKIIDALYPAFLEGHAKGRIILVNHIYGD